MTTEKFSKKVPRWMISIRPLLDPSLFLFLSFLPKSVEQEIRKRKTGKEKGRIKDRK